MTSASGPLLGAEITHQHGTPMSRAVLRIRLGVADIRYGGGVVDGAHILGLFGDLATELSIRHDHDEGLCRAYEEVEFLAPVRAGDFIEAHGALLAVGRTSRRMAFEAYKVIASAPDSEATAAQVLAEPLLVARAIGTTVTPLDRIREPERTAHLPGEPVHD